MKIQLKVKYKPSQPVYSFSYEQEWRDAVAKNRIMFDMNFHGPRKQIPEEVFLNMRVLPGFYEYRSRGGYVEDCSIQAEGFKAFFEFLKNLMANNPDMFYISQNEFNELLDELIKQDYLDKELAEEYRKLIPTEYTLEDKCETAEKNKDARLALKIAYEYKQQEMIEQQLVWLCNARKYNPELPFFKKEDDLQDFFSDMEIINPTRIFDYDNSICEWMFEQLAKYTTLKTINFEIYYNPSYIKPAFYNYLAKSTSVTYLDMSSVWSAKVKMLPADAAKLAEALKTNTSLEQIQLADQHIGDKGFISIIDALIANPETKIKALGVFSCCITAVGIKYLADNLYKIPSLQHVNLKYNSPGTSMKILPEKNPGTEKYLKDIEETLATRPQTYSELMGRMHTGKRKAAEPAVAANMMWLESKGSPKTMDLLKSSFFKWAKQEKVSVSMDVVDKAINQYVFN